MRKREGTKTAFGTWLLMELARREMTQAEFSRRAGFSSGVISLWVNGDRAPSPESCQRIADALFLDIDEVLDAAGIRRNVTLDDPQTAEFIAQLRRVRWNPDRVMAMKSVLGSWLEMDRLKSVERDGGR